MKTLSKYFRVFTRIITTSIQKDLEYRTHTISNLISSLGWLNFSLFSILVLNAKTGGFGGWSPGEMLVLTGVWMINNGLAYTFFYQGAKQLVKDVYQGKLDYTLLLPIDSHTIATFGKVVTNGLAGPVEGLAIILISLSQMHVSLHPLQVIQFSLLIFSGVLVYHSLWSIAATLSIHWGPVEHLIPLVPEIIDSSKFPSSAYPKILALALSTLLPVLVMTTVPAQSLLGTLSTKMFIYTILIGLTIYVVARRFWSWSLKYYTSANL